MKKVLLSIAILSLSTTLFAQSEGKKGEVRLKNGSIVKGVVAEDENGNMSVEGSDGVIYEYESKDIQSYKYYKNGFAGRRRGYIGITAGASIPVGDFADKYNGAAKVGLNLSVVNFGYLFNEHIGITGTWFGQANPIDGYDPWAIGGLTAGPLFSFQLSKDVDFDLRPMVGYSVTTVPDIGDGTESAAAFAFNGSIMFRFHCSSRISILLHSDFLYTKPSFDYYNFEQNISTISINGGIAYRFR